MTKNYDELYNLANQTYIDIEITKEEFIINQLKFMYGAYYDKVIRCETIYVDNLSSCFKVSSNDVLNDNILKQRPYFENFLFDNFRKYYDFSKETIILYDFNDCLDLSGPIE